MSNLPSSKPNQAVHVVLPKAPKFNNYPSFTKAGFTYFQKYQNVRRQSFHQRIAVCNLLKAKANNLFLEKDYSDALVEYEQALSIYRYIFCKTSNSKLQNIRDEDLELVDFQGQTQEEQTRIKQMKVALYNNITACYLKLDDSQNAIAASGEVLALDSTQAKAWYRRALATLSKPKPGIQDLLKARDDLKVAYELDPHESSIEEQYIKVKEELEKLEGDKKDSFKPKIDQKDNLDQIEEKRKSSYSHPEKSIRSHEANQAQKQQETKETSHGANKKTDKSHINKPEKVNSSKEPEETKFETQSTASDISTGQETKGKYTGKIENDNDVWKMLHGDIDPNSQNFGYELSFEINPNAKVPKEIQEFGKFIENRAKDLMTMYEKSGRRKDIGQLRENLRQAMNTHKRLENISKLDFNRPGAKLRETAAKLNLDLNDPSLKVELQKMQEQNLEDVRKWLKAEKAAHPQPAQSESRYEKLRSRKYSKNTVKSTPITTTHNSSNVTTTINNYFINNNYFGGPSIFSRFFSSSNEPNSTTAKNLERQDLPNQKGQNAKKKDSIAIKGSSVLRIAIYFIILVFFGYLLIIDHEKQVQKDVVGESNQEV